MPPKMNRQNAFSGSQEIFKEIACRICYASEKWGEWKRITCECSIIHDYYLAHELCFNKRKWCKVCLEPYVEIKQEPRNFSTVKAKLQAYYQFSQEKIVEYKNCIALSIVVVLCILFSNDLYNCTTITKVDKSDLSNLSDNEYLWLPVFDLKCFKSTPSFHLFNLYSMGLIFSLLIILYCLK